MHMTQAQLLAQLQQIKAVTGAQIAYYQTDGHLKISTDEQHRASKFTQRQRLQSWLTSS